MCTGDESRALILKDLLWLVHHHPRANPVHFHVALRRHLCVCLCVLMNSYGILRRYLCAFDTVCASVCVCALAHARRVQGCCSFLPHCAGKASMCYTSCYTSCYVLYFVLQCTGKASMCYTSCCSATERHRCVGMYVCWGLGFFGERVSFQVSLAKKNCLCRALSRVIGAKIFMAPTNIAEEHHELYSFRALLQKETNLVGHT